MEITMPESELSRKIADYIQKRANARLEKFDKEAEKQRKETAGNPTSEAELLSALSRQRAEYQAEFKPSAWLSDAAMRAKQIGIVTHALKFTHTDAKGSSVYVQKTSATAAPETSYLSTSSLSAPKIDVVGNAAALDVAGLLQLADENGVSLINRIAHNDTVAFAPFAENGEQLAEWMSGFKSVLADKELSSHKLAKQLYFPLADDSYHLLGPLYASSLSQAVYQAIADSRYPERAKAARKARKENKYSEDGTVDYLNVAVQSFGGTKPQNVSQLNSSRGGKSFLLSCQPPVWQKQLQPPSGHKNAFWREYNVRAWKTVKELKDYLTRIYEKDSTKPRRDRRAELVDELINILFLYAAEIQSLVQYSGWSAESKLSMAEQLWLDPLRSDEEFQRQREAKEWQQDIANQFASWLNRKLESDKLVMKDTEHREWSSLVGRKLALLKEDLEVLAA